MIQNKIAHVAVISHNRTHNLRTIITVIGLCDFYVNNGEGDKYRKELETLGIKSCKVFECGTNICQARNYAMKRAKEMSLPCIQVSDDLKSIKRVYLEFGKHVVEPIAFEEVVLTMIRKLEETKLFYGGVAVTSNRLNYTGIDASYDKLIVNDLICLMPQCEYFDESVALKEDYDLAIRSLFNPGGLVRLNNILCDFPHRDNKGGANDYRTSEAEQKATDALYKKWPHFIMPHKTREGQVSLNYKAIKEFKAGQQTLF
jgi:hypothetical protein